MNEYMQAQALKKLHRVMEAVMDRSENCERGPIAITNDGRGLALVAPDCILYVQAFPGIDIFELCLN
jgi:hypothetical protein